jgi:hypothetical protein
MLFNRLSAVWKSTIIIITFLFNFVPAAHDLPQCIL